MHMNESNEPRLADNRQFRWANVLGLLGTGFVKSFLIGFLWLVVEDHQYEEERRQRIEQTTEEIRQAVRRGEAGEVFNRLYPQEHAEYQQRLREQDEQAAPIE